MAFSTVSDTLEYRSSSHSVTDLGRCRDRLSILLESIGRLRNISNDGAEPNVVFAWTFSWTNLSNDGVEPNDVFAWTFSWRVVALGGATDLLLQANGRGCSAQGAARNLLE